MFDDFRLLRAMNAGYMGRCDVRCGVVGSGLAQPEKVLRGEAVDN
jgi:hypothetical protein